MVGGMGGLTAGFSDLLDGTEKQEQMSSKAIMGNLEANKMIMGPGLKAR